MLHTDGGGLDKELEAFVEVKLSRLDFLACNLMLHTDGGALDKELEAFVGVSYLD